MNIKLYLVTINGNRVEIEARNIDQCLDLIKDCFNNKGVEKFGQYHTITIKVGEIIEE